MTDHRARRAAAAVVALGAALLALGGCGDGGGAPDAGATSAHVSPTPAPPPPPAPKEGDCYRLSFQQAVAPTVAQPAVPCTKEHTASTYHVGQLDTVVDGHLLAVDSRQVQDQVRTTCPRLLSRYVGGGPDAVRLSMIHPVWFTPSVEQSDRGASWFRCDAVVVAADHELADLHGSLKGVLARDRGRDFYAMCGTDAPSAKDFERVQCSEKHSWRAISVVPFTGTDYPGTKAAKARGQSTCEDAAGATAANSLQFKWSYEWPTRKVWRSGQHYGICWAED